MEMKGSQKNKYMKGRRITYAANTASSSKPKWCISLLDKPEHVSGAQLWMKCDLIDIFFSCVLPPYSQTLSALTTNISKGHSENQTIS